MSKQKIFSNIDPKKEVIQQRLRNLSDLNKKDNERTYRDNFHYDLYQLQESIKNQTVPAAKKEMEKEVAHLTQLKSDIEQKVSDYCRSHYSLYIFVSRLFARLFFGVKEDIRQLHRNLTATINEKIARMSDESDLSFAVPTIAMHTPLSSRNETSEISAESYLKRAQGVKKATAAKSSPKSFAIKKTPSKTAKPSKKTTKTAKKSPKKK